MSDGVNIKDAAGNTIPMATDDTPVGQVQLVKLDLGGNGENAVAEGALPVVGPFYQATQPVSVATLPLPAGAATSAKQDSALTYQATLETLIETLQELTQRLAPIGGVVNMAGGMGLRVVGVGGSYAVSGPITSAQSIAEKNAGGVAYTQRIAAENLMAHQGNIINCVAA